MKSYTIIVADQGLLKAFYIKEKSLVRKGKANLIKRIYYTNAHHKLHELLSDTFGRFRGSGDRLSARHGSGEDLRLKNDIERKSLKALAHDIEGVIGHTPSSEYYLSLPKAIAKSVLKEMKNNFRLKIKKTLSEDLTKDRVEDIRLRFGV
jgi:hypothetical protein